MIACKQRAIDWPLGWSLALCPHLDGSKLASLAYNQFRDGWTSIRVRTLKIEKSKSRRLT
jgi:hypothetical protein